jgi:Bacteriophage replication protein O
LSGKYTILFNVCGGRMRDSFEGFEAPNTTPVPDVVFDELLSKLTGNELKVLLYIIRRTYGFGKSADAISLSQFRKGITTQDGKVLDNGCGIEHNRTILVALASLEKNGYVTSRKRQSHAGDSDATIYKLHFKSVAKEASRAQLDSKVVTSSNHPVTSSNDGSYSTSPRWLPQVTTVVTPGNTQETVNNIQITRNRLQENISAVDEKIADEPDASTNVSASPTFFHPNFDFIAFDDSQAPTTLFLYLLPLPDWSNAESVLEYSEHEDKRREGATRDVVAKLNEKGIHVKVIVRREKLGSVVDASQNKASNPQENHTSPEQDNLSTPHVDNSVDKSTTKPAQKTFLDMPLPSASPKTANKGKKRNTEPLDDIPLTEEEQQALDESIQNTKRQEAEQVAKRKSIKMAIIARRGFDLQDGSACLNENKFVKKLAEKYTLAEVEKRHKYLFEEDEYWSDESRKYSIGAHIIWKQGDRVGQILNERERKQVNQNISSSRSTLPPGMTPTMMKQRELAAKYGGIRDVRKDEISGKIVAAKH